MLVEGGTVVSPEGRAVADVGIRGGKVLAVGSLKAASAAERIDASGLCVLPGVIDSQVHFREPGMEHKEDIESGSRSALLGGVTSYLEMPNTNPTTTSRDQLEDKLQRAGERSWSNYGFFVGASLENLDDLKDLETLPGTPGIKIFVGSSTGPLLVSDEPDLRRALESGRKRVSIHAEDEPRNRERRSLLSEHPHPREHPYLRDAESARIATQKVLRLSEETGRPVHILHVSTADEPPLIAAAKRAGLGTSAEVTPQHLWFEAPDCYERLGPLAQMNPPIRGAEHRRALWRALREGVFDVFGSDHAPHTLEEKRKPYPGSPSGMPGVQTLLPALTTFAAHGRFSLETIVQMTSRAPARLFGISGKGEIAPGYDADLVLLDPARSYVLERSMIASKCAWSPYEGETFTGSVEAVVLGGRVAAREGELLGPASGQMLRFEQAR